MAAAKKTTKRKSSRRTGPTSSPKTASGRKKLPSPKAPSAIGRWWNHLDEPARRRVRGRIGWAVLFLLAAVPVTLGLARARQSILAGQTGPVTRSFAVRLADAPYWMPRSVVDQIEARLIPSDAVFNDRDLAGRVFDKAQVSPWIVRVAKVRKHPPESSGGVGLLTVHAEYRRPFARILWPDSRGENLYFFTDRTGVVLPAGQVPVLGGPKTPDRPRGTYFTASEALPDVQLKRLHYVTIGGLAGQSVRPGQRWQGQDLQAGLQVVKAITARRADYYRQIHIVDVSNYGKRRDQRLPEIVLLAREGRSATTRIAFGRLPRVNGDYVVPVSRKLDNLAEIYKANGGSLLGIAGLIDLRQDPPRPTPLEIQRASGQR
jgi:hypothetical protein